MPTSILVSVAVALSACAGATSGGDVHADWGRVPVTIELRLAVPAPGPGLVPAVVYGRGDTTYLHPRILLANPHITRAEALEIPEVSGHHFTDSDYLETGAFNQTASHGGLIRAGLPLRVTFVGDDIARLEVAMRQRPAPCR
jgi:hypothetical protein